MDCSPPGSSVYGILQARTLEWVAVYSPRGCFPTQDHTVFDLPKHRVKPAPTVSPALASSFFTTSTTWEAPSWIRGALSPMDGVLRKERGIQDTQKERPHQGGDRGWNEATSGIADRHQKPGEAWAGFCLRASEDTNRADTLISDSWPPELWGNKFLLFQASHVLEIYNSRPRKLI